MKKYRVAMLRGGLSDEHNISLKSGDQFKKRIDDLQNITDITVDKMGEWFINGIPYEKRNLVRDFDMVVNTIKGGEGENGRLSSYLDTFGVYHNNSSMFGSNLSHNKHQYKKFLNTYKIKTPIHVTIDKQLDVENQKKELRQKMFLPAVVKPAANGSSIGVYVAMSFDEINKYIDWILMRDRFVIVEEYIEGLDVSCMTTNDFRGQNLYSFVPVGIDTPDIINYDQKYNNTNNYFPIHNLSHYEKDLIQDVSKDIHALLDLDALVMTDFRVHPKRGIYVLETNTVPSYEDKSIYDESLKVVGVSEDEIVEHIINLSLNKKRRF